MDESIQIYARKIDHRSNPQIYTFDGKKERTRKICGLYWPRKAYDRQPNRSYTVSLRAETYTFEVYQLIKICIEH